MIPEKNVCVCVCVERKNKLSVENGNIWGLWLQGLWDSFIFNLNIFITKFYMKQNS